MKSIKEISVEIKEASFDEFQAIKLQLKEDNRKGVLKEIEKKEKYFQKVQKLIKEYKYRQRYEIDLFKKGYTLVAGLDEVGRGPLAGPVYAAVVILNPKASYLGVRDSKKLSEKQRLELSEKIKSTALDYCIASATPKEIDEINILNATKLAMERAINGLKLKPEYLLLDAINLNVNTPQTSIIKGDDNSISIGAASIIAKVARDDYMKDISIKYPEYDFESNKGYGTAKHIDAISSIGPCEIHRRTFIKNILGER
ncbi:ribonuclease HII [Clostridium cylindrosporum]|uniref:Ribonuclease HII n=1 Tax=Clostridium cylindrosporum DSM 605 TaxID=1121307 RepID=A0A0J8G152_CLOCY|nr:ribonuclease HII [Clostridium cylindrosporum]KMT21491.1 ribonuclease HII [Clostridium cylindrosporum DSM 605]